MGERPKWVVKDPLSGSIFYFTEQEFQILKLADGTRGIEEIQKQCQKQFDPRSVAVESLNRFFTEAMNQSLVTVAGVLPSNAPKANRSLNLLALRVPGINPDGLLDRFLPLANLVFAPVTLCFVALAVCLATLATVVNLDMFADHLRIASKNALASDRVFWILVVISLTKIVHELGHALACKRFGGECRELGVMFLVGVPCLYCDVSDSWLLDRRWKRILVSAGGMVMELSLAAIATFVWLLSAAGGVRDIAVTVMVVCSVSTLLFNGNPLLRYDGYFMLSDWMGIPNLGQQASTLIRERIRGWIWGASDDSPTYSGSGEGSIFFLSMYGALSGLYRVLVYALILWMFYRLAERFEMGFVIGSALLALWGAYVFRALAPVLTLDHATNRNRLRPLATMLVLVALVFGLVSIPLPRTVVAPMIVRPAEAETMYAATSGHIVDSVADGDMVEASKPMVKLENYGLELQEKASQSQHAQVRTHLVSLNAQRSNSAVNSLLPSVHQRLEDTRRQLELKRDLVRRLGVTSRNAGVFFTAPEVRAQQDETWSPRSWRGSPTSATNRGAWIEKGTRLGTVGHPHHREAIVYLTQQQAELVEIGQRSVLLLPDRPYRSVFGQVCEVSLSPSQDLSPELVAAGKLLAAVDGQSAQPYYRVLLTCDTEGPAIPSRTIGHARIQVENASIGERLWSFWRDSIR